MDFNAVPANIKRYMLLRGYSLKQIGCWAGISERTMYARLRDPDTFTLGELFGIAKHLKINFEKLLETA